MFQLTYQIVPWFVFLLAITARLVPGPRTIDDAYITYRYARNLLNGEGFVFNPGERVLGTTTPLYAFLLAGLGLFLGGKTAHFPEIALAINAACDGITCLLLVRIGRRLSADIAGLGAAFVWAIAPFSVTFAIGGLETSLYVLLLVAMSYAHLELKHTQTAALAALAYLTRPDAILLIAPLAFDRLLMVFGEFRHKTATAKIVWQPIITEVGVFLIPILFWSVFATFYFGSPIPHSIAAKSLAYRLGAGAGFMRLLQHYNTPFLGHLTFGNSWIAVGMVLYPFMFLVGGRFAWRQSHRVWPLLAYPYIYFIVFALANPLIFRWYLTPPLPFYFLFILTGLFSLIIRIGTTLNRVKVEDDKSRASKDCTLEKNPIPVYLAMVLLVIVTPVTLSLHGWEIHPDHGINRPAPDMAWYKLELLYKQAADILMEQFPQVTYTTPLLAAGDVGVLGYYTQARLLDTVGLNSPQSTRYYPADPKIYVINYAIPADLILDNMPDFITILEVYGRNDLLKDPRFIRSYLLVHKISTDIYGSDGLLIFRRVP